MKNFDIKKILIALFFLHITHSVFAFDLTCPPIEKIKSVKFLNAKNLAGSIWLLNSASFEHAGNNWNVWIETYLKDANTIDEALNQGQKYFDNLTLIKDPSPTGAQNAVLCIYNTQDYVFAISPPLLNMLSLPSID